MALSFKSIQRNISLIIIVAILAVAGLAFYFLKPKYDELRKVQANVLTAKNNLKDQKQSLEDAKGLLENYEGVKESLYDLSLALPTEQDIPNLLVQLEALASENGVLMKSVDYSEIEEKEETEAGQGKEGAASQIGSGGAAQTGLAGEPEMEGEMTPSGMEAEMGIDEPRTPTKAYAALKVSLSLEAQYYSFMDYLNDVQQNLRFLDVTSVSFDIGEGESESSEEGEGEEEIPFEDRTFEFSVELCTYYLK